MGQVLNLCRRKPGNEDTPNSPRRDLENPIQELDSSDDDEQKLDPKDFMAMSLTGETVVKKPGQIDGQQFIIESCKDCDIFLLDYSAAVNVDLCENCRIFIGPCESSVFIRDSKNCKVVVACQQLRLRDCTDLDMLIYVSAGQPSIESSSNIRIGCFQYQYFSLKQQFAQAGLSVWNSEWSNVHDFTEASGERHWDFLPASTTHNNLLKPLSEVAAGVVTDAEPCTPVTYGTRPRQVADDEETCFLLAFGPYQDSLYDVLDKLRAQLNDCQLFLLRTRCGSVPEANLGSFFNHNTAYINAARGGTVVGLEFRGLSANEVVKNAAADALQQNHMFISGQDNGGELAETFFEQMRATI